MCAGAWPATENRVAVSPVQAGPWVAFKAAFRAGTVANTVGARWVQWCSSLLAVTTKEMGAVCHAAVSLMEVHVKPHFPLLRASHLGDRRAEGPTLARFLVYTPLCTLHCSCSTAAGLAFWASFALRAAESCWPSIELSAVWPEPKLAGTAKML